MSEAVIGLVGVTIGGLLTTGGQVFTGWLQRRRDDKASAAAEAKRLRLAVRLVMEELAEASALIQDAARPTSRRYWPQPRSMPTETWNEYRTEIATALDSPLDWRIVTSAYDAINNLNWIVGHRRQHSQRVGDAVHGVTVLDSDGTRDAWRSIRTAIGVLERTIEVQGPASRVMRDQEDAEQEFWPFGDGDDFDVEAADVWSQEHHG